MVRMQGKGRRRDAPSRRRAIRNKVGIICDGHEKEAERAYVKGNNKHLIRRRSKQA